MNDANQQPASRKPVDSERETLRNEPPLVRDFIKKHRTPATLFPVERQGIVGELRNGRSISQAARAYSAEPHVCIELWMRKLEREILELRRGMYGERIA